MQNEELEVIEPVGEIPEEPNPEFRICSPWVKYVKGLQAMFAEDNGVGVVFDEDANEVKLLVDNSFKAEALMQILPAEKQFGNVTLKVTVVPGNAAPTVGELYGLAFAGNPILKGIYPVTGVFTNPITYVMFEKKVVQYFIDDMSDIYGNRSTLYQTIAEETFNKNDGVFFTTDIDHPEEKPQE